VCVCFSVTVCKGICLFIADGMNRSYNWDTWLI